MINKVKSKIAISVTILILFIAECTPVRKNYLLPEGPRYTGHFAREIPEYDGQVKVVTYNIKLGKKIEQAIHELSQREELQDADIILLQEMDPTGVERIALQLQYNFVYYPAVLHSKHDKEFGNAILSKWPILDHVKIVLPHEHPLRKMRRIAVFATLEMGEYEILACSVHTEMYLIGREKKLDQVKELVRNIEKRFHYVIVGGDFNTDMEYDVIRTEQVFQKSGLIRATQGIGYTSQGDPLGILRWKFDHIFVKGFDVVTSGKLKEAQASDHLPVWTILKISELEL